VISPWEHKAVPTEKQIAANRANAKKSTGPKTAVGKLRSSRNAYRHGLSVPGDQAIFPNTIAHDRAGGQEGRDRLEFAQAQKEVLQIRAIRTEKWAAINLDGSRDYGLKDLKRLAALDRYERYALTKRRRASNNLF
jgi:hypothetical protein